VFLVARAPALADLRPSHLVPPLLAAIPVQTARHPAPRPDDLPEAVTEPVATAPAPGAQTSRHRASHQE
jgi:hypothetical protein